MFPLYCIMYYIICTTCDIIISCHVLMGVKTYWAIAYRDRQFIYIICYHRIDYRIQGYLSFPSLYFASPPQQTLTFVHGCLYIM